MNLLNQTIQKILPPDQRAIKFVEHKLDKTMTNAQGLGELQNLLLPPTWLDSSVDAAWNLCHLFPTPLQAQSES